ncbi:MAG: tetratricopeptide repeat protein [Bacteroidales bacterium]|nr:tetratricopeptide repeat protein [Bacteroidales bacterium]
MSAFAQQSNEQMASFYYQNGEFDKAIELYEPLYQRTQNRFYYQMLYESFLATERLKEAEKLAEKRLRQYPSEISLYVDLGQIQLRRGEKKKAEKTLLTAIEKLGNDSRQLSDLVQSFQNIRRPDLAVKAYLQQRERQRNPFAYVMELATLYQAMGDYESMTAEYFSLLDNSPGNMGSIQIALQKALSETSNPKLADGLRSTLVSRVQKDPNNRYYLDMMIWFSLQQKDFQFAWEQARAVDQRFPSQGEEQIFRVATIAHNNSDYTTAASCYRYLIGKGAANQYYFDSRVGELRVKFDRINKGYSISAPELTALKAEYQAALDELGKEPRTVPLMRNYAYLLAYYADDVALASDLLYDIIEMPQIKAQLRDEVKLDLGDLLLFSGSTWDASLLYSQVEKANKNDLLGSQAKFRNAKLSYYNNDFEWAKSQLDVLRASTSKLIANDAMQLSLLISDNMEVDSTFEMLELYAAADLDLYRNRLEEAWQGYESIAIRTLSHPLLDEVLLQKARIRIKQARYAEADSLLQHLVDFYPHDILADDALLLMAELNEDHLNNMERARSCYERILLDYPSSLYTDRARRRYNELKASSKQ